MGFSCAWRSLYKDATSHSDFFHNAALLLIRWLWKEYFAIEAAIRFTRIVLRIDIISRPNFGEVPKFAGNVSALLNPFLNPLQCLSKTSCGSLSQDKGRCIFNDGFIGCSDTLCFQRAVIFALRIDRMHES